MNIKKARKAIEAHYYEWLGVQFSNISDDDVMAEIDNLKRRGRDVFGLDMVVVVAIVITHGKFPTVM